ncbi:unnamed protein product [Symbiodinium sp. CCMP2592]|nr:unnamed protein product [Symbiodinium sp. CCMP2592]
MILELQGSWSLRLLPGAEVQAKPTNVSPAVLAAQDFSPVVSISHGGQADSCAAIDGCDLALFQHLPVKASLIPKRRASLPVHLIAH